MNDTYRIDSHKLIFHPRRVARWLDAGLDWDKAKSVYPLYVEMSPIGACNHRCVFCALDYMGYKPRALDIAAMRQRLPEMAGLGVRSVMFAGEGEPLLYRHINELTQVATDAGIDVAFTSNGVLLDERFIAESLPRISWIKISCNAGRAETYAQIHRTRLEDFARMRSNLRRAVQTRDAHGWKAAIGLQILLLPENHAEVAELATICRDEIGADYLVVKPYSQHPFSETTRYAGIEYGPYLELAESLQDLGNERFKVIFRARTMEKYTQEKPYATCLSTPFFWAYVMSGGDVFSCSAWLGDPRFRLGNLHEQTFREIWEGPARRRNFELVRQGLEIGQCRHNCRMDEVNIYLWNLLNPPAHANFI